MEPMEAEAMTDEGTSSDETMRSDEGTCSDESAAHADAGSTEATATVNAAAEAAHASIRGRGRRHCTNEGNGRSGNHDLTPHDLSSCPFSGTLSQSRSCMKTSIGEPMFSGVQIFLGQFLTRKSVLCRLLVSSALHSSTA
jgi:hypothetical protein